MLELSDILNYTGENPDEYYGSVAPPLIMASNFRFHNVHEFRTAIRNEKDHLIYSRGNNPTVVMLCKKLAALEKAEEALVFGSGMAAISTAILSQVKTGDHIICQNNAYSWVNTMLTKSILPRFGVTYTFVDGSNTENVRKAVQANTSLIYLESPGTMTMGLQDLAEIAAFARNKGIITIADNSHATPLFQNPIALGVDIVVHSATKYLSGHSDNVAGVLCSSAAIIKKIFHNEFLTLGGIISPFNAWLMLRSLRTLEVRMERISASAVKVADFLVMHPKVEEVIYPMHPSHPQHALAKKQMAQGSGLISFLLKTKEVEAIERFCNALKYFSMAVSWGGYESLMIPACTFLDPDTESEIPFNLIRLSIGLEDPAILIADLDRCL